MDFHHIPVHADGMYRRSWISIPNGIYVDGTAGGGGHSSAIAAKLGENGRLISLDRDPDAVAASERLSPFPNAQVIHSNYSEMRSVLDDLGIDLVDGILMDLGVSSFPA